MSTSPFQRILIVGYGAIYHMGSHFLQAARQIGLDADLFDANAAQQAPRIIRQVNWRLRGHRPVHLDTFSRELLRRCTEYQPDIVLVTGITAPNAKTVAILRTMGISCVNYLTDDPWNPNHRSTWFMDALPYYTWVFSPRKANLSDLTKLGCVVSYLPFAYNPELHFHESPPVEHAEKFACDVLFYGGADQDRIPYIEKMIDAGINVHLYGGYWDRNSKTRSAYRGMADAQTLRWAVSSAKITLCLVRRANRDGHVMRTFETPAMGACLLAEETEEHREILGEIGLADIYCDSISILIEKTRLLLKETAIRSQVALMLTKRITEGNNTYTDRLRTIIQRLRC